MSLSITVTIQPSGKKCGVMSGSDITPTHEPCIVIPISNIEEWTDEEIGAIARSLVPYALEANDESFAQWIIDNQDGKTLLPDFIFEDYGEKLANLERFRGKNKAVDVVLSYVEQTNMYKERKKKIPAIRKEMAINYDKIFVKIGRRDGFTCKQCDSAKNDLTIDHVMPVIKGGTNDLKNLQLLCRSCNIAKRDS